MKNFDDTAFHFNPRLHQKVVMNSFRNRKWEAKESVSDNPFKKGETFEIKLHFLHASSFPTTFTSLSRSHGELSTRQSEILQPVQNPVSNQSSNVISDVMK
uniref:Galectin n=1 Tax=Cyprinus carpio TaxID=7962 RepID=A0A8C1J1I0_CYPCA